MNSTADATLPQTNSRLQLDRMDLRRVHRSTVLAYHELLRDGSNYSYALSARQFEEHLRLAARLRTESRGEPLVASFDDGHISNYTIALPLLEKYGCKATFFVLVGRIGKHANSLCWQQLREMNSLGHRIESHGWAHRFLTDCAGPVLDEELLRSREVLEDHLGRNVEEISAPHGRWNLRVLKACGAAGYRRFYTSDPWTMLGGGQSDTVDPRYNGHAGIPAVKGRLVMSQSMDAERLLDWLTMNRVAAGFCRTRYAVKISARRILGNKLYYRLWASFAGWNHEDDCG
jgi:peptidoglycan/xylan/chitin deacetylase (PgdA/CDA1 family)